MLGAAGGIGTAAIQVGKALGATVIGGVADESQLEVAHLAGADDAFVLSEGFNQEVRARTGGRGEIRGKLVADPPNALGS